jgi:hypothetical protein
MRLNALLARGGVQGGIRCAADGLWRCRAQRAHDFVVARAAVQPAQEENVLHAGENEGGENGGPVDGHRGSWHGNAI